MHHLSHPAKKIKKKKPLELFSRLFLFQFFLGLRIKFYGQTEKVHKTGGCWLWLEMCFIIHHTHSSKGLKEQFTPLCSPSAVAECCNTFILWSSRNVGVQIMTTFSFFWWPFPSNLELKSNVSLKVCSVNVELWSSSSAVTSCLRARLSTSRLTFRALTVTSFCSWQRGTLSLLEQQTNTNKHCILN